MDRNEISAEWIYKLVAGDEAVVTEFYSRYAGSLERLAASRMARPLQQRAGADDILQSVCRTFFRRSREGEFEIADADDLWRLLCAITLNKVRQQARFHNQAKRRMGHERSLDESDPTSGRPTREVADDAATPADAAEFADALDHLLDNLNDEERQIVMLRIEDRHQDEIAREIGCSERTVRRLLVGIRARWSSMLDDDD